jgi:hypothetical protein
MESEVRLTRAQKWDLVRMSAAAVVSTIFFSIPLFLARPDARQQAAAAPVSRPEVMTTGSRGANQPQPTDDAGVPAADSVGVTRSTVIVSVTRPVLQASLRRTVPAMTQARQRPEPPAPFSRRLARFIAGNGKYEVKPFPSLNTPGS